MELPRWSKPLIVAVMACTIGAGVLLTRHDWASVALSSVALAGCAVLLVGLWPVAPAPRTRSRNRIMVFDAMRPRHMVAGGIVLHCGILFAWALDDARVQTLGMLLALATIFLWSAAESLTERHPERTALQLSLQALFLVGILVIPLGFSIAKSGGFDAIPEIGCNQETRIEQDALLPELSWEVPSNAALGASVEGGTWTLPKETLRATFALTWQGTPETVTLEARDGEGGVVDSASVRSGELWRLAGLLGDAELTWHATAPTLTLEATDVQLTGHATHATYERAWQSSGCTPVPGLAGESRSMTRVES